VVKEIENATKMKKAKQEANQAARAMKKALKVNQTAANVTEGDKVGGVTKAPPQPQPDGTFTARRGHSL